MDTRAGAVLLVLAFRMVLDIGYALIVERDFSYAQYTLDIDVGSMQVSYALLLAWMLVLPFRTKTASWSLFNLLFLLIYVPLGSFYAMRGDAAGFFILANVFFAVLALTIVLVPRFQLPLVVPAGRLLFVGLSVLLVSVTIFIAYRRGAFALATLSVGDVYDVRHALQDDVLYGGLAYLTSWSGKVVLPALLVVGLWLRSWSLAGLALALSLMVFMVTSAKEMLVFPIGAAVTYGVARGGRFFAWSVLGLVVMLVATLGLDYFGNEEEPSLTSAIVFQRAMFAQAKLGYDYFYFFRDNPHTYWSNAFLASFVEYPYADPVPLIIGYEIWGEGTQTFANTGIVGSAYMHFGAAGVAVFAAIVGLLFRLVDILAHMRMPQNVGLAIATPAALQFVNGDLSATLLSHGFGVMLVALFLVGRPVGGASATSAAVMPPAKRASKLSNAGAVVAD